MSSLVHQYITSWYRLSLYNNLYDIEVESQKGNCWGLQPIRYGVASHQTPGKEEEDVRSSRGLWNAEGWVQKVTIGSNLEMRILLRIRRRILGRGILIYRYSWSIFVSFCRRIRLRGRKLRKSSNRKKICIMQSAMRSRVFNNFKVVLEKQYKELTRHQKRF